ncbi:hypothetical protein L6452_05447 [Arctium lappa]|uniref:Uncharacterized protein n=1 Tax=Arctium lappa TaxID=4217 RepID=A0ACB9EH51_ARCLA|nr:hypothetical protein L6452_05447 [Arctium lappa]
MNQSIGGIRKAFSGGAGAITMRRSRGFRAFLPPTSTPSQSPPPSPSPSQPANHPPTHSSPLRLYHSALWVFNFKLSHCLIKHGTRW